MWLIPLDQVTNVVLLTLWHPLVGFVIGIYYNLDLDSKESSPIVCRFLETFWYFGIRIKLKILIILITGGEFYRDVPFGSC